MKMNILKCPNCNAELEAENGIDSFYCKYCGTKIFIDDQSEAAIKAKKDILLADKALEAQKELHRAKMEEKEFEARQEAKGERTAMIIFAIMGIVAALIFFFM